MLRLPRPRVGGDSSGDTQQSSTELLPHPPLSANALAPPGKQTFPVLTPLHFWKPEKNFGGPFFVLNGAKHEPSPGREGQRMPLCAKSIIAGRISAASSRARSIISIRMSSFISSCHFE